MTHEETQELQALRREHDLLEVRANTVLMMLRRLCMDWGMQPTRWDLLYRDYEADELTKKFGTVIRHKDDTDRS